MNMSLFLFISKKIKSPGVIKAVNKGITNLEAMAKSLGLNHKILRLKDRDIQTDLKRELNRLSVSQISPIFFISDLYYIVQLHWKTPQISPEERQKKVEIEALLYKRKIKQRIKPMDQKARIKVLNPRSSSLKNRIALTTGEGVGKTVTVNALKRLGPKKKFSISRLDRSK